MSETYHNWERLVYKVLDREKLRRLCYVSSRSPSISSDTSSFSTSTFASRLEFDHTKFANSEVERTANLVHDPGRIGHQHAPCEYVRNIAGGDGSEEVTTDRSTAQINRMLEELRQLNLDPTRSPSISSESSSFSTSTFFSRLEDESDHAEFTNSEIPRTANRVHDQPERIGQQHAPHEHVRNIAREDRSRDAITDHLSTAQIIRMWEELRQFSRDPSRSPRISSSESSSFSTSSFRTHLDFDYDKNSAYSSEVKRTANLVEPERIGRDVSGGGEYIKYRGQKEETRNEGEKKVAKGGEKKAEDGGGKKDAEPITVVLKLDFHCEGCAKKVRRFISHFEGVERVKADCHEKSLILTVTGNVHPAWLREQVEIKTKKKVDLIFSQPKEDSGGSEKKTEEKKADDDKKPEEAAVSTVVMKIKLHCHGCAKKMKRGLTVNKVRTDLQKDLVTVVGTMDAKDLTTYLKEELKRNVEIIPPRKVDDGGGEKKEKESGRDKEEKEEGGGGCAGDTVGGEKKGREGDDKKVGKWKPLEDGGQQTKFEKVVWKLAVDDERSKQKVLEEVSSFYGVEYVKLDMKDNKLTVIGNMDAVAITKRLRKHFHIEIMSVERTNEAVPMPKPQLKLEPEPEPKVPEKEQPEKRDDKKMGQVAPDLYYYQHQYQPYQLQGQVTPNIYYYQPQYQPYQLQEQVAPTFYHYQSQYQPNQPLQVHARPSYYNGSSEDPHACVIC